MDINIMSIERAIDVLKRKENYIVPGTEMDEAINVAIEFLERYIYYDNDYITLSVRRKVEDLEGLREHIDKMIEEVKKDEC